MFSLIGDKGIKRKKKKTVREITRDLRIRKVKVVIISGAFVRSLVIFVLFSGAAVW